MYVAFLRDAESTLLDTRTVGFASPTKVWQDSKEIIEGSVVLSIEYVKKINKAKQSALYLHELGSCPRARARHVRAERHVLPRRQQQHAEPR